MILGEFRSRGLFVVCFWPVTIICYCYFIGVSIFLPFRWMDNKLNMFKHSHVEYTLNWCSFNHWNRYWISTHSTIGMGAGYVWAPPLGRRCLGAGYLGAGHLGAGHLGACTIGHQVFCFVIASFFCSYVFRFVVRFARIKIEDSSRNRFTFNGIQRIVCSIVIFS